MKILLISDSHGKREYIEELLQNDNYQYVFFAGDGLRDLGVNICDPKFVYVKGNCDFFNPDEPITQTLFVGDIKIFITHGDYYKVKYGLENLHRFAMSKGYMLVCFGHTHNAVNIDIDGVKYINAGSLKNGDYAEIEIVNKKINVNFKNVKDNSFNN